MRPSTLLVLSPILAAIAWLATILSLLILWLVHGRIKYEITSPDISFISNIGSYYKTLFIIGASVTAFFFVLTLCIFIFYHRHTWNQRNATVARPADGDGSTNIFRKPRTWSDFISFLFGLASSAGLVLLTIYDSANYDTLHWVFTLIFAFAAIVCAIFNLIGISISRTLKRRKMSSFFLKIIFVLLSTGFLLAMIALMYSCKANDQPLTPSCNHSRSIAAILEWGLAGLFFIFILTWVIDFS